MSTIEEFMATPSTSFEDVTDTILARGGPKSAEQTEVQDAEIVVDESDAAGGDGSGDLLEAALEVVDGAEAAVDPAATADKPTEVGKDVDSPAVTPVAVESAAAEQQEDVPEPRRRRRRR